MNFLSKVVLRIDVAHSREQTQAVFADMIREQLISKEIPWCLYTDLDTAKARRVRLNEPRKNLFGKVHDFITGGASEREQEMRRHLRLETEAAIAKSIGYEFFEVGDEQLQLASIVTDADLAAQSVRISAGAAGAAYNVRLIDTEGKYRDKVFKIFHEPHLSEPRASILRFNRFNSILKPKFPDLIYDEYEPIWDANLPTIMTEFIPNVAMNGNEKPEHLDAKIDLLQRAWCREFSNLDKFWSEASAALEDISNSGERLNGDEFFFCFGPDLDKKTAYLPRIFFGDFDELGQSEPIMGRVAPSRKKKRKRTKRLLELNKITVLDRLSALTEKFREKIPEFKDREVHSFISERSSELIKS